MWLLSDAAVSGGGDTLYTLLSTLAVVLLGSGGALRWRAHRRRPAIDPEPVARRVADGVEPLLKQRIKQLEREVVEKERQLHDERAKTLQLVESLATCRAERADLMYRLRNKDGSDD